MGWTETRLDYEEDPQGNLLILRVDPLEMFWDAGARRKNLAEGRYIFRSKDVPVEQALEMFPNMEIDELHAQWAVDVGAEAKSPHDAMAAPYYRNDQSPDIDKRTQKIRMVEAQWYETEKAHRVIDPQTRQPKVVTPDEFQTLQERMQLLKEQGMSDLPPLISAEVKKRICKRALLGSKILKEWDGPEEGGFTYKCMTGKRDRNKGTFYGLVRGMIDPQKWANKWLSQTLHILNSTAKGGILAEEDAFEDQREAEAWLSNER
jgi:hypothetical protein